MTLGCQQSSRFNPQTPPPPGHSSWVVRWGYPDWFLCKNKNELMQLLAKSAANGGLEPLPIFFTTAKVRFWDAVKDGQVARFPKS